MMRYMVLLNYINTICGMSMFILADKIECQSALPIYAGGRYKLL